MKTVVNFKLFLLKEKDKENATYEDFYNFFIKNTKMKSVNYEDNSFDGLLENLYNMEDNEYSAWRNAFDRIGYSYVKRNYDTILELSENSFNYDKLKVMYDMSCRQKALVSRSLPFAASTGLSQYGKAKAQQEIINFIDEICSEDSKIVESLEEEYEELYSEYAEEAILGEHYNKKKSAIRKDLLQLAKDQIVIIGNLDNKIILGKLDDFDKRCIIKRMKQTNKLK